jgi:hypothetical protein
VIAPTRIFIDSSILDFFGAGGSCSMAAKGVQLPRAQVARMMATARATSLAMQEAVLDGYRQRATDPLERAKLALQRAGLSVFSHSLHVPDSTLIVVGSRKMTAEELMQHAQRHGRW